jgi:hypothetical protein
MKRMQLTAMLLATLAGAASIAQAQPTVTTPGLMVKPFAGLAAGLPPLSAPKFGLIDMPGGVFGGLMYISELGGREVSRILPNGFEVPFTVVAGPTQQNVYGVDIDGPIANLTAPTMGLFGGPALFAIAHGGLLPAGAPLLTAPPPGGWLPWFPFGGNPGPAQLQFDRTPGFRYGGFMYVSEWGADQSDGIFRYNRMGGQMMFCPMPGQDPRYFTFDVTGGAGGYGPNAMWVSSYINGTVFNVSPAGIAMPYANLARGIEGLAFGPGDPYFGNFLYVANLDKGIVDIVMPGGIVRPFAAGFPGAAYIMFVTQGPYAKFNKPTMYLTDGMDSVWVIFHCPADFNNDGFLDFFDFDDFVLAFEAGNADADFNGDGFLDFFDFDDFVTAFETGC